MGRKKFRVSAEDREKWHVPDVNTMVMWHDIGNGKKEQRCPYCFSRKMRILDYGCTSENEKRFGDYKFILKCTKCNGRCKAIVVINDDASVTMRKKEKGEVTSA